MKKTIITALIICAAQLSFAQQDLFSAIKSLGSEMEYAKYSISLEGTKYTITPKGDKFNISVKDNPFGKPGGIEASNIESGKKDAFYDKRYSPVDHYTHPSYQYKGGSFKSAFVMVDSVIYQLQNFNKESLSYKFYYIYIPIIGKAKTNGAKKKMSMKEKIAAAKSKLSGSPFVQRQRSKNHKKIISDYLAAMKKVQKAHPYSAQTKKEINGLESLEKERIAKINARNAEWEATKGKSIRALNAKSTNSSSNSSSNKSDNFQGQVYFKLQAGSSADRIHIHYGSNGAYTTSTTRGSSASIKCQKGKVYYSYTGKKSDMKLLQEISPSDCGKTINVN